MSEDVVVTQEVVSEAPLATGVEESASHVEESSASTPAEDVVVDTAVTEPEVYQYKGLDVTLDITDSMREMASSKGFDINVLASELYKSEDFKFSDDTLKTLNEAYGEFFVSAAVDSLRMKQDTTIGDMEAQKAAHQKAQDEAFGAACEIAGGEEGWGKLEAFAATLPEEDIDNFNAAMDSGNQYLQALAVKDLMGRMNPLEVTEVAPVLNLVDGEVTNQGERDSCSAQEYRAVIASGEYYKDVAKWDRLRRVGMSRGI